MTEAEIIPPGGTAVMAADDFSDVPTEDLKRELADAIGVTARNLARLATIWHELEARGEDLSALRGGLFSYLPMIADGRLDPEFVVRCAGQALLLKAASRIPLIEQRDLLDNGATLVSIGDNGEIEQSSVSVEEISSHQIRKIFIGDRLRPAADQVKALTRDGATKRKSQRSVIVKVRLTSDEYQDLRQSAAAEHKTVPTYARERLLGSTP